MAAIMQKAVHGYDLEQYLGRSADLLAGFVLPADQVAGLTPAQLYEVHGLRSAGWAVPEYVDVLRFSTSSLDLIESPSDPTIRPPYAPAGHTGLGGDDSIPVYYLDPMRVPAGAELWRISGNGAETLLGVYPDTASGWMAVGWDGQAAHEKVSPQDVVGTIAVWDFNPYIADIVDEGNAVVLCAFERPYDEEPQEGDLDEDEFWEPWTQTRRGLWRKKVDVGELTDLFEGVWACTFRGLPFRVTGMHRDASGEENFTLHYLGHDASAAKQAGLNQSDVGVYWITAAGSAVADLEETQRRPAKEETPLTPIDEPVELPDDIPSPGSWALWQGQRFEARNYSDEERLILLTKESDLAPGEDWNETPRRSGAPRCFSRSVPFAELDAYEETTVKARWRGFDFSIMRVDSYGWAVGWAGEPSGGSGGQLAALLKRSWFQHRQVDRSTYEARVPLGQLTDFRVVRRRNLLEVLRKAGW